MTDTLRTALREMRAVWMLVIVCVIIAVQTPVFLTPGNLLNVLLETSVTALLAIGQTYVIILAEIDLSDGALLGLSAAVSAIALSHHLTLPLALVIGLAVGAIAGLINGLLVTATRMPSFIATLGTMSVFSGLTLEFTGGNPITITNNAFDQIGQARAAGVPVPVWVMLGLFIIFGIMLARSRYGRFVYSAGDNPEASQLSGIPVKRVKVYAFVISGVLAAVAGFILTARLADAEPTAGSGMELDAIAAVIIGGTSLLGGRGNLVGTLIGALILGVIDDGMNLLNVSPFLQSVVKGGVILFAVFLDRNAHSMRQLLDALFGSTTRKRLDGPPGTGKEESAGRHQQVGTEK